MSDHTPASAAAVAAPPAARSTAEASAPLAPTTTAAAAPARTTATPHITCFACSRCEYPICDSSDLLLRKVRQGASDYAFQYNLDGLLDLEERAVPCYSAAEVVHTSAVVADTILSVPLPPVAKVVALESIVQSRKFWVQQRRSMNARLHEHGVAAAGVAATGASGGEGHTATDASSSSGISSAETTAPPSTSLYSSVGATPVVRRYGDSTESRIDLVCVQASVLETGLQECTQDRSAAATTLDNSGSSDEGRSGSEAVQRSADAPTVVRDPNFAHVPPAVLKAATAAAATTHWTSPGNMSLREAFIEVNRTTLSSRAPWFQDYRCVSRVQCPDCHQALGFVFAVAESTMKGEDATGSAAAAAMATTPRGESTIPTQGLKRPATTQDRDEEDGPEVTPTRASSTVAADATTPLRESGDDTTNSSTLSGRLRGEESAGLTEGDGGARLPHAKKTRNENDAQAAAAASTRRGFQEALQQQQQHRQQGQGNDDGTSGGVTAPGVGSVHHHDVSHSSSSSSSEVTEETAMNDAPPRFVGLELKRVVQRGWDLHAFQDRYRKSQTLTTFRELFPEAEELQSLYSRLLGLRTQTELYNSLLRRHKEQNDVQMALLNSNKDRMRTYDEKVKTMQQIIEAQRAQIEMQTRQIRNQEELVQSHRRQFTTQQRQMDVEQLLLSQQSRTIESQKEQLRLLKVHFREFQPEVFAELGTSTSPPPAPLPLSPPSQQQQQQQTSCVAAKETDGTAAQRLPPPPREESAEDEWADVVDDAAEQHRRDAAPREVSSPVTGACRATPPAHLCGVPTSFAATRDAKRKPADDLPPPPS